LPDVGFWTVEEANSALPRVSALVERVREVAPSAREEAEIVVKRARTNGRPAKSTALAELQSAVEQLAKDDIVLRDPETGLVDFPAISPSGRHYWLCWLPGEDAIEWWHWPEDGFAGRTPLTQPPE
jgi:hypothetical protein